MSLEVAKQILDAEKRYKGCMRPELLEEAKRVYSIAGIAAGVPSA